MSLWPSLQGSQQQGRQAHNRQQQGSNTTDVKGEGQYALQQRWHACISKRGDTLG